MRISSHILTWIQLLIVFNMMIPISANMMDTYDDPDDSGESPIGSTQLPLECPQRNFSIVFTLIPRLPYTGNVTGTWAFLDSDDIKMTSLVINHCSCLASSSMEIKLAANKSELENIVRNNKTDFGFPIFLPSSSKKVFKKHFHAFLSHPGFDLFTVIEVPDPVQVCIDTLFSSWPILALSVIFTGMAGIAIWICETLHNREEFPMSFTRGSWEGFWWAFISMTTVGYGDKCPRSVAGRCFAVFWVFGGLCLVSVFMANVTTALTSANKQVTFPQLAEMSTVGVLKDSIEEGFAKDKGAETESFTSLDDLIHALVKKKVDGILVDRYVMGYHLSNLTDTGRLTRIKQFPAKGYSVGAVVTNPVAKKIFDDCYPRDNDDDDSASATLNQSMVSYGSAYVNKGYSKLRPKPNVKSFNLFIEARDDLRTTTIYSCGVLAGLVIIGIILDIATAKKRHITTREHELKVNDNDEILQDIRKSKEMLNDLQCFLRELEEKVKKQQTKSYEFLNEAYIKR